MIDSSINPRIDSIALRLKTIPESPGVYQHLDSHGKVIYVGKARNLHKRVSQYFTNYDDKSAKIRMLVRNIHDIRVTVVASEVDALLLENNLIKQYQPRYNSLLKDDKTYPYLCLTDEPYPRLIQVRNHKTPGQYFGPYPNGRTLRELQEIIRQLFPLRSCGKMGKRPCLKYQMGLCGGPCADLQTRDEYLAAVEGVRRILKGEFSTILRDLQRQMLSLAKELRFEEADALKRKIRRLEEYQHRSTVVGTSIKDIDVYSILSDTDINTPGTVPVASPTGLTTPDTGKNTPGEIVSPDTGSPAYVNMMRVRDGAIVYSFSTEVRKQLDESDAEILSTVIPALHEQTASTAREAVVPFAVPDLPPEYLRLTVPTRGDRLRLLELSLRNVKAYQLQCRHQRALLEGSQESRGQSRHLLERIQKALNLPEPPRVIECFDNSNIQGAYPVAAMVRFTDGKPDRKEYRKFNIKTVEGPDDYASMSEVIFRRYKRLSDEGKPLPDILIVDGGRGQMEVARNVIKEQLGLDIPIAGLAKDDRHHTSQLLVIRNEELGIRNDAAAPITNSSLLIPHYEVVGLKPTDPLFHLLEQIQNEVHRFAITFHRDKRSKATFRTQLTDIPGIGPKTARQLLLRYGSVKEVLQQSEEDLAKVIGPAKAHLLFPPL